MELHVKIDRPRWLPRLTSRRRKLAVALAVAGLVAAPVGVMARDFTDVPPASQNGQTVDKVSDAGIIRGCGDATRFCPERNLTRLEMAQWFSRGGGSVVGVSDSSPQGVNPGATGNVIDIDVDVPGISGFQQQVKVDADVIVQTGDADNCPCEVSLFLQDDENPSTQFSVEHTVVLPPLAAGEPMRVSASLSFVFDAETNTTETFILSAVNEGAPGDPVIGVYGDLTATTYPFAN